MMPQPDELYCSIMNEINARLISVDNIVYGRTTGPFKILEEFCYLQFRMVCELIALGCLVAHGDITMRTKLRKAYDADIIFKELDKLHPDFYPKPVAIVRRPDGHFDMKFLDAGFPTRKELAIFYGKCGNHLHRGNLRKLISPQESTPTHFVDVESWLKKIDTLLRQHWMALPGGKECLACNLRGGPHGANMARVSVGRAPSHAT